VRPAAGFWQAAKAARIGGQVRLSSFSETVTASPTGGSIEKNDPNSQKIDAAFSISLRAVWG
jgi:hypothetical protein